MKRITAHGEAGTHGLQIMRFTRCLLGYEGLVKCQDCLQNNICMHIYQKFLEIYCIHNYFFTVNLYIIVCLFFIASKYHSFCCGVNCSKKIQINMHTNIILKTNLVFHQASVAQQAARQSHNLKAVSSSLTGGSYPFHKIYISNEQST